MRGGTRASVAACASWCDVRNDSGESEVTTVGFDLSRLGVATTRFHR